MSLQGTDPIDHVTVAFGVGFAILTAVVSGRVAGAAGLLVLNLAVGLPAVRLLRRWRTAGGVRRFFGVTLPLLVFYVYYRETALALDRANVRWLDAVVARLEWSWWQHAAAAPAAAVIGEVCAFGYMAYVPLLLIVAAVLLNRDGRGPSAPAESFVRQVCIAWALCYVVFLLVPVLGPRMAFPDLQAPRMGRGPFSLLARLNQDHGMVRGAAFPSAHVAATAVALWSAWRANRRLFWLMLGPAFALVGGAVYLGYHYLVDIAAGLLVGALVGAVDQAINRPPAVRGERPARSEAP